MSRRVSGGGGGKSDTLKIGNQSLPWESAKFACKVVFCCLHHCNARSYFCVWFFFPKVLLEVQRIFGMPEKDCLKTHKKIRSKLQLTNLYKTHHDFGYSQTMHFDQKQALTGCQVFPPNTWFSKDPKHCSHNVKSRKIYSVSRVIKQEKIMHHDHAWHIKKWVWEVVMPTRIVILKWHTDQQLHGMLSETHFFHLISTAAVESLLHFANSAKMYKVVYYIN